MKAGFFVMIRNNGEIHYSKEYETMEEFFMKTKIPFEEKKWNINFFERQSKDVAMALALVKQRNHYYII